MFMCFGKFSSVINSIYSGQKLFNYIYLSLCLDGECNQCNFKQLNKEISAKALVASIINTLRSIVIPLDPSVSDAPNCGITYDHY
jgi:hypothetical protein